MMHSSRVKLPPIVASDFSGIFGVHCGYRTLTLGLQRIDSSGVVLGSRSTPGDEAEARAQHGLDPCVLKEESVSS